MNLICHLRCKVLAAAVLLLACTAAQAQTIPYDLHDKQQLTVMLSEARSHLETKDTNPVWLKVAAISSYQLAVLEVKSASEDAVNYLTQLHEADPSDAGILARLGSATVMLGRDSSFFVNKLKHAKRGLVLLDQAEEKSPADLTIRLIRARVSNAMPAMFSRKTIAHDDYAFIVKAVDTGQQQVAPDHLAEAYLKLGEMAMDDHDKALAATYFAKAVKAAPDSSWAEQAAKKESK